MTTPLLLEHKPLDHMCARCYHSDYLPYETPVCPNCGRKFETPKVVFPVDLERILVGRSAYHAHMDVQALEDARVLDLLAQLGEPA
jgi:hypothetical protein